MTAPRFKAERINRGWTARDLAKAVGVSRQTVHDWDRGAVPRPQVAVLVAEVFGLDRATDLWPVGSESDPETRTAA